VRVTGRMLTSARRVVLAVLAVAGAASASACTDFGYEAPPPVVIDAGEDASEGGATGDGCVEGPVEPSADGPQIRFYALDVDLHLLTIHSGQAITWTNGSSMPHTATAGTPSAPISIAAGGFDSGTLAAGGSKFAWRFCDQRTIEWFCRNHAAQMFGYMIVVGP
jgi:plastocyanin